MNLSEKNRLSNVYRREAMTLGIVSPYRQSVYIKARLRGKMQKVAETLATDNTPESERVAKRGR